MGKNKRKNNNGRSHKQSYSPSYLMPFILILIGLAVLVLVLYSLNNPEVCTNKECFISFADKCEKAKLNFDEDFGIFEYSSSKDCVLTKTLVSLDKSETQEMKDFFEGKSMACRYDPGSFDEGLIDTLSVGMESCSGELRTALETFFSWYSL